MPIQYGGPSRPAPNSGTGYSGAPAKKPKPAAAKKAPAVKAPVSQTIAQVASQRAKAQIAPQAAAQAAFARQQNAAIQSFAQAMLGKLQPIAGQVGAQYDSAIQQQGALSGQAAGFLSAANPTGQVADLLKSANAPQAQQDQVSSQLGQTFGGGAGVLAFTGGTVPGGQLAADKAAAQGQAAQLPAFAALRGQQDLASALWQQGQSNRELEATRPGLYQQAQQDVTRNVQARSSATATARQRGIDNSLKVAGLRERGHEFDVNAGIKTATIKERGHEFDVTTKEKRRQFEIKTQKADAKALIDYYVKLEGLGYTKQKIDLALQKFVADRNAKNKSLTISQQNADTAATRAKTSDASAKAAAANASARLKLATRHETAYEKTAKAKASAKTHGLSATSYANLRKQALAKADLYYYGKVVKRQGQVDTDLSIPGIDYPEATKRLMHGYSLTKKDAQAILDDFYAPGEGGRPAAPVKRKPPTSKYFFGGNPSA